MNLEKIRQNLANRNGQQYWRSLEEAAQTPEFQEMLEREFPQDVFEWKDDVSRRGFLKLMGASLALAGLTACTKQPDEKIIPYVRQPEEIIPGKPLYFATAMPLGGFARGMLVESHMGRPTKTEGNPDHPASLGATDAIGQAAILSLYDPDRSQAITNLGNISSWSAFYQILQGRMAIEKSRPTPGLGLRILTESFTSPTLAAQMKEILDQLPGAQWHQYEAVNRDNVREGARLAFGEYVHTYYRFDQADVIVSLDSDFMTHVPGNLRYIRDFTSRRRVRSGSGTMNRLYCIESTPTITGAKADHRWAMRAGEIASIAGQIHASSSRLSWLSAIIRDLQNHRGKSIVIAGHNQPPEVHALVHQMNHALGNTGTTVIHTDPVEANPVNQSESLKQLVRDMNAGIVDVLLILGGNPVYNAPSEFNFAAAMSKVDLRIRLGLYEDETSSLCHWHIPETHFLETWSDVRSYDGNASIIQPLIAPLYGGKSAHEFLSAVLGQPNRTSYEIVRAQWQSRITIDFERSWRKWLHDGIIPDTAATEKTVTPGAAAQAPKKTSEGEIEITFHADPHLYDGSFSNNGWLQELPRPLTKITWDNVVHIAPATAEKLHLANEDVVKIESHGKIVMGPVWIHPGQPEDSIAIHLGSGRTHGGKIANGAGFNAYQIRTSNEPWISSGRMVRTGEHTLIACAQGHHTMENRHLVRSAGIQEYLKNPNFAKEMGHDPKPDMTLYPGFEYPNYAWGMAIDLNACIGCNACVLACVSENNIPVVGKDQVSRGREMPWIRIDRYFEGQLDDPDIYFQPVPCMHCENAPCEVVCPVNATVHSSEGLNDMVYNRCVGTRYCSNNCPYKVRRFNFYLYSDLKTPSLKMMRNPDVTVRTRGVMEKCTYCVQRINHAKIEAEKEGRSVRDGEIVTACQQSCPAEAIVFGNINDPNSKVAKLKADSLNYGILADLNTRPRTTYLAHLRNPNPEIEEKQSTKSHSAHGA